MPCLAVLNHTKSTHKSFSIPTPHIWLREATIYSQLVVTASLLVSAGSLELREYWWWKSWKKVDLTAIKTLWRVLGDRNRANKITARTIDGFMRPELRLPHWVIFLHFSNLSADHPEITGHVRLKYKHKSPDNYLKLLLPLVIQGNSTKSSIPIPSILSAQLPAGHLS